MSETDHINLPDLDANAPYDPPHGGVVRRDRSMPMREDQLDPVLDVPITLTAILGRTQLPIGDVLQLDAGSIVELDRAIGEPIDIFINNRLVARGEVVLIEDRLGITMSEILSPGD
jgi:flagellar motor switch protein FliN/FliY